VVDTFRVVTGLLLSLHYVEHMRFTPDLRATYAVSHTAMTWPGIPFATWSAAVAGLGVQSLRAWFGSGMVLGACIALGLAPRGCAAVLLGISAATYHGIQPAVILDDALVQALTFWLVLLPTGQTLTPLGVRNRHRWGDKRVGGSTSLACVAFFLVFLLGLSLLDARLPPLSRFGLLAATGCAMAPIGRWRTLAVLPAAAGLWSMGYLDLTTLVGRASVAICSLFVATMSLGRSEGLELRRVAAMGAADAIGGCAVVILGLQIVAADLGILPVARSTGAVLANAGLVRPWQVLPGESRAAALDVGFALAGEGHVQAEGLDPRNHRLQAILRLLEASSVQSTAGTRSLLIRSLLTRHCSKAPPDAVSPSEDMVLLRDGREVRRVARLQCQPLEEARVVPIELDANTGAASDRRSRDEGGSREIQGL